MDPEQLRGRSVLLLFDGEALLSRLAHRACGVKTERSMCVAVYILKKGKPGQNNVVERSAGPAH